MEDNDNFKSGLAMIAIAIIAIALIVFGLSIGFVKLIGWAL